MIHYVNGHKFITLFYDAEINRFVDGLGNVMNDIFRIISPNQLLLFRESKKACIIPDVNNTSKVSLIYLDEEE